MRRAKFTAQSLLCAGVHGNDSPRALHDSRLHAKFPTIELHRAQAKPIADTNLGNTESKIERRRRGRRRISRRYGNAEQQPSDPKTGTNRSVEPCRYERPCNGRAKPTTARQQGSMGKHVRGQVTIATIANNRDDDSVGKRLRQA